MYSAVRALCTAHSIRGHYGHQSTYAIPLDNDSHLKISSHLLFTIVLIVLFSVLELWKADLKQINEKAAEALADPVKYPNLFPDLEWALQVFVACMFSICQCSLFLK